MKATTTIKDLGLKKFVKQAKDIDNAFVTIGVHKDATYAGGNASVAEVAIYNEYGTRTIPARPFLQLTLITYTDEFKKFTEKLLDNIVELKLGTEQALEKLGFRIEERIKNVLVKSPEWAVENNPSYKAAKGNLRPLFNSGTMYRAIGYQTVIKDKESQIKGRGK